MDIQKKVIDASGIKFYIESDGKEVARAYLYLLQNDLHDKPFGLMEDVFINEDLRGQGHGSRLVQQIIETAKTYECYKLICTSRHTKPKVHELYQKIGFRNHGNEFRIDF